VSASKSDRRPRVGLRLNPNEIDCFSATTLRRIPSFNRSTSPMPVASTSRSDVTMRPSDSVTCWLVALVCTPTTRSNTSSTVGGSAARTSRTISS
jgi:hypothetical protein